MFLVCGTMAGATGSKILNQPVTFESNLKASQGPSHQLLTLRKFAVF